MAHRRALTWMRLDGGGQRQQQDPEHIESVTGGQQVAEHRREDQVEV